MGRALLTSKLKVTLSLSDPSPLGRPVPVQVPAGPADGCRPLSAVRQTFRRKKFGGWLFADGDFGSGIDRLAARARGDLVTWRCTTTTMVLPP